MLAQTYKDTVRKPNNTKYFTLHFIHFLTELDL